MKQLDIRNTFRIAAFLIALTSSLPASAESAMAGSYNIDPAHSFVHFSVNHLGTSNLMGSFNKVSGNFKLNPDKNSKIDITIKTNSVNTNNTKRDAHLRSPDFFNSKQYPIMKFVSNNISYNRKGEPVSIAGKLSLHGVSQNVALKVNQVGAGKDPWGGYRAGYKATTIIKRSAFGMNFMQGGIGDDISITLNIEAIKQ